MSSHPTEKVVCYKSTTVVGFLGYKVGTDGSVWSRRKSIVWKRMIPARNHKGYLLVRLSNNGRTKTFQVHRLVLLVFVGTCPSGKVFRHLNDVKDDNRLENLAWGTPQENWEDRRKFGHANRGEHSGKAVLTDNKVREIRRLALTEKYSLRSIGRMFGVSVVCVIQVVKRKTWIHVK
jgi:hypothetical protein